MKLRYLFSTVLAASLFFTGCSQNEPETLTEIQVSDTYLTVPESGGTATITLTTTDEWHFVEEIRDAKNKVTYAWPDWLTADKMSGGAGSHTVVLTAEESEFGREAELIIRIGGHTSQFVRVRQGSLEASDATCQDVIDGPDGKTFIVEGVCTVIENTIYGNWYLDDGTGKVYIYGTLDAEGKTQNFASLNIEVGDVVKVQGPKDTYGDKIGLVNVTVLNIEKALLTVVDETASVEQAGGEISVRVAYKGNGSFVNVPEKFDWIQYLDTEYKPGIPSKIEPSPADTAVFKFSVAANTGSARVGEINFTSYTYDAKDEKESSTVGTCTVSQLGSIIDATVTDFLSAEVGPTLYRLTGVITGGYSSDNQGQSFYLKDWSGETLVYRLDDFKASGAKIGDIITVVGQRGAYKDSPQMVSGVYEEHVSVTEVSVEEFLSMPDLKNVFYMVTGTITKIENPTYGNLYMTDGVNEIYVYGCYPGYGATGDNRKNFLEAAGIKVGDELTMIGYKDTYNGTIELCGGTYFSHKSAE